MHPILKDGVSIGTYQYDDSDEIHYYAENSKGEEFELSYRVWNALMEADGTHPLDLPNQGRELIPKLKRRGLIQTSRFVNQRGVENRFILFAISKKVLKLAPVCRIINTFLPVASVMVFLIGLYLMFSGAAAPSGYGSLLLPYMILIASLVIHEAGHMIAGIAYGYEFTEFGILLLGIIPMGAYVAHKDNRKSPKPELIQFALAGIEMDLLVIGFCLILGIQFQAFFISAVNLAVAKIFMIGLNLLPFWGTDGEAVVEALSSAENDDEEDEADDSEML